VVLHLQKLLENKAPKLPLNLALFKFTEPKIVKMPKSAKHPLKLVIPVLPA